MDFGPIKKEIRYQEMVDGWEDRYPLLNRIWAKSVQAGVRYDPFSSHYLNGNGSLRPNGGPLFLLIMIAAVPVYTVRETAVSLVRRL